MVKMQSQPTTPASSFDRSRYMSYYTVFVFIPPGILHTRAKWHTFKAEGSSVHTLSYANTIGYKHF